MRMSSLIMWRTSYISFDSKKKRINCGTNQTAPIPSSACIFADLSWLKEAFAAPKLLPMLPTQNWTHHLYITGQVLARHQLSHISILLLQTLQSSATPTSTYSSKLVQPTITRGTYSLTLVQPTIRRGTYFFTFVQPTITRGIYSFTLVQPTITRGIYSFILVQPTITRRGPYFLALLNPID